MARRRSKSDDGRDAGVSLSRHLRAILGQPCWGVEHSRQLNLSMSFGHPSLVIREPRQATAEASPWVRRLMARRHVVARGRWWLWVYLARWQLTLGGGDVVRWTSPRRARTEGLRDLDGQRLTAVRVDPADGRTRFSFDLGAELEVWRLTRDRTADELWKMYLPDGHVVVVTGDGGIARRAGTE